MLIPDHETAVDFLNYEAIAKTVVGVLRDNRPRALTIGIHGDWGAGKSSVLKMVEAAMAEDKKVACLWFNGWTFQGFDDAKTVLIEATIAELVRQRSTVGKVKELGSRLGKRIDWLKLARRTPSLAFAIATGMPSPDMVASAASTLQGLTDNLSATAPDEIAEQIAAASSYLKPAEERSVPEEIHQFRQEFAELLDEAKIEQLVVLIDDLDRCLPATAIDTVEAIRLFLFVPKTAFIIGADEGMIEYAVRQHFPSLPLVSGPIPYARHYLEKLIQVPVRIPALGVHETRVYVTLLLVKSRVGEDHAGFDKLLETARGRLNRPWLGAGLSQQDVRVVEEERSDDLDAAFLLAQQIGPILAEGTNGNPRQVKRFLNALFIRRTIAEARGFADSVNEAVLAKLMLAERFQADFYDHIASAAMLSESGQVRELSELETAAGADDGRVQATKTKGKGKRKPPRDESSRKWLDREWLQRWLKLTPMLGSTDLRPYVFVARDKRILVAAGDASDLDSLIELLAGPEMAARSAEPQVRELSARDAERAFTTLRERTVRHGVFNTPPPGFEGLRIIAKHHPPYQSQLLSLVGGLDASAVGMWVVKGWQEILTDPAATDQLSVLLSQWAAQDLNPTLKRVADQAIATAKRPVT